MLAKIHKNESASAFVSLSLPRFGDVGLRTNDHDEFHHVDRYDEDDSVAASEIIRNAREEATRIIAAAREAGSGLSQEAEKKSEQEIDAAIETAVSEQVAEIRRRLTE